MSRLAVGALSGLMLLLIFSIIVLSSVPPVSKDALVHHLAIPELYLKHGGIYEIPFVPFSYYPMNLDLLYLVPLYFGNDIIPKFMHFSFALLTGWLLFGYLRRRLNTTYALLGAIFFLSTPVIVKLSITVYVDLGLVFFSTAALLLILKWLERGFSPRYLVFSAIFSGLAMGTKYNGLVAFFLLSLFVPFLHSRLAQDEKGRFFKSIGYGLLFVVIGLLVFSPWVIRNYAWTNNPVFPLYDHWFNSPQGDVQKSMSLFSFRAAMYGESWWQMALLPIRIFFEGRDGSPQYFDGRLNPFLLLLPFFAFYRFGRDAQSLRIEKTILFVFVALFFAFAFFTVDLRIRYISPIIPPLVLLSIYGLRNMAELAREFTSRPVQRLALLVVFLVVIFFVGLNAHYLIGQFRYVAPFDYLRGKVSRHEYIARYRPEYPAIRYINEHLPSNALILHIFTGNRGYYCERDYVLGGSLIGRVFLQSKNPEEIRLRLEREGITHLLIYHHLFEKWVENNFSSEDADVVRAFFKRYVRLLFYEKGFSVSALGSPSL